MTTQAAKKPQHLVALERAQSVRLARYKIKRDVSSGVMTVAQVIGDKPECVENMTVFDLLKAQQRWGATKVKRFLALIPISEGKTIGTLTDRQRRAIIELIGR